MINIPIVVFVLLIVSNTLVILFLVLMINLFCYLHDMIKVSIDMRKEKKNGNKTE